MTTASAETRTASTTLRRLADLEVRARGADGLDAWVADRRAQGQSWRRISFELQSLTGVEVTNESLRRWFGSDTAEPAA